MAYINPQTKNLKVCFQSHYSLPYFQREYKWEPRHFAEMLDDIQSAFLLHYEPTHGRKEVANYSPYFLGSIITSAEKDGKRPLIDGQQRLTSMFMLLAYLQRYQVEHKVANALSLETLLGSISYGAMDYSIQFSPTRKRIFDCYLDMKKSRGDALRDAEDVSDIDDGDKKLLDGLRAADTLLNSKVTNAIAYFIDYVVERVLLIDISVDSEAEAHRVFVTMNDRGLRLGPIDLLKGQILAHINVPADAQSSHIEWTKVMNELRAIDPEEDSLFFRHLFRAKWADTIRGKAKGDPAGDFDVIGEAYHRWFTDNLEKLAIKTSDDYVNFAKVTVPGYAATYSMIKSREDTFTPGFEWVYYNSARRYSFQSMVLLACTKITDTTQDRDAKIALVSRFLDLILTTRTIEGKENTYDNLKELSFSLAKEVRDKDVAGLTAYIQGEWGKYLPVLSDIPKMRYAKSERSDILYLLARIGCCLEDGFGLTNKVGFPTFWQRDRGMKTFDIEHLLKDAYDTGSLPAKHGFTDQKDYDENRNLLGALTLLPRSRNRSLQDKAFKDKIAAYATENVLTQTLVESFYQNNPGVASYLQSNPTVQAAAISDFSKDDIARRADLYVAVAREVWKAP